VNRYEIDNAVYKVDGYFIPRTQEQPDATFQRAKSERLDALKKEISFLEQLNYEQFLGTRRAWSPSPRASVNQP
jgi:hypothetical protein